MQTMTMEQRQTLAAAGLRAYPNIARAWGLKEQEAARLLGVSGPTYRRWKRDPNRVQADVNLLERLSLILGIYKALHILLPRPESAHGWVRRPNTNPRFGGHPPLERMLGGHVADLVAVREHLDAARG
ncbi:MbcA/ParS/Xre antitoxin family protein [Ectothiorhodospira haloalkaliphila]|uniref:MbcA/ParS/Xre antitoxin family protein n=1 Tax=Ectothiorhodospiraceae TaxID=72276 RepID=UPI001905488E|nr:MULTISPECIES: MbcA/ParS/Xre antitoxin family protein [Ectothiorhodospiraceae]MCG5526636.1 MbcA/ParS/Xre antitoxin family protein [Ectothiorhodospira haloalkaliphila]